MIIQTINFKGAMDKFGIAADAITSGPNKSAGSPFQRLSPEHRAIMQKLVDDFYARFSSVVAESRPNIPKDKFATVTDGRIMSGVDAHKMGLVDELGDLYTAHDKAKELAGIPAADLILYHRPLNYVGSPYAAAPGNGSGIRPPNGATQINLVQLTLDDLPGGAGMGFYYLWLPAIE